ncbi:MAG: phage tail protein [Methyloprofundus sp.]|nr:phage tail protein [Methyloprofundus sp.]
MSDSFTGEIRMFAGNFAPRGWAFCNGQLLNISQYDALFSLLGTNYGGDGRSSFGLPDMRGRIALHAGSGQGLSSVSIGHKGGQESVTLSANELSSHSHRVTATNKESNQADPTNHGLSQGEIYSNASPSTNMNAAAIANTGGNTSHNNLMPTLCIHYIISLEGVYPSRN